MGNGKITKKENKFTQVSNAILLDENISLKAIGLYGKINAYLSRPDWTLYKSFLMAHCKGGRDSFNSAWKELKDTGYLLQIEYRDENGKYCYDYELLNEPMVNESAVDGFSVSGKTGVGKPVPIIIQTNNTSLPTVNNTEKEIQSVSPINNNIIDGQTEPIPYSESYVKESVGYDALCAVCRTHLVDAVIANMVSMWYQESVKVKGSTMPSHVVRSVLSKITHWHVIYIIEQFENVISPIKDKVAYMQSLIYNSVMEMDIANLNRNNSL